MPQIFLFTGHDHDGRRNMIGARPATLDAITRFACLPLGESLDDLDDSFLDPEGRLVDLPLAQLDPENEFDRLTVLRVLAIYRHAFSRISREINPIIDGRPGYTNAEVEMLREAQASFLGRTEQLQAWLAARPAE